MFVKKLTLSEECIKSSPITIGLKISNIQKSNQRLLSISKYEEEGYFDYFIILLH